MNKWILFVFVLSTAISHSFQCDQEQIEVIKPTKEFWQTMVADTFAPALRAEYATGHGLSPDVLPKRQPSDYCYGSGGYVLRFKENQPQAMKTVAVLWTVEGGISAGDVLRAPMAYSPHTAELDASLSHQDQVLSSMRFLDCRVWVKPGFRHKNAAYIFMKKYVEYLGSFLGKEPWCRHLTPKERLENGKGYYYGAVTYVEMTNENGLRLCAKLKRDKIFPYVLPHCPDNDETVRGFYLLTEQALSAYPKQVCVMLFPLLLKSAAFFERTVEALPKVEAAPRLVVESPSKAVVEGAGDRKSKETSEDHHHEHEHDGHGHKHHCNHDHHDHDHKHK